MQFEDFLLLLSRGLVPRPCFVCGRFERSNGRADEGSCRLSWFGDQSIAEGACIYDFSRGLLGAKHRQEGVRRRSCGMVLSSLTLDFADETWSINWGHTLRDRNIVTSPNRSKTRKTSRRSLKVLAVGWIFIWTVRSATLLAFARDMVGNK